MSVMYYYLLFGDQATNPDNIYNMRKDLLVIEENVHTTYLLSIKTYK